MESMFQSLRKFNTAIVERGVNNDIKSELQRLTLTEESRKKCGSVARALELLCELIKCTDEKDFELMPNAFACFIGSKDS
ncbi:MAG: hypothetical protein IJZ04_03095 [Clostridia bacterium]|nr:hypothetical protein [Clostridia bacterium]